MIRIEKIDALGKDIRKDDLEELGIPTWTFVKQAIRENRNDEALKLIEYALQENRQIHDFSVSLSNLAINNLAASNEEKLEKILRSRYVPRVKEWLAKTPGPEESLQILAEYHRGHYSSFTVTEEPDRYVMRLDPCGSGGRLRRDMSVGTTKKAYPWTWSRSGVAYYCIHCPIFMEIVPIEQRGYPICIVVYGDRPEDPCLHLFYKKPELIPEEYFTMVGKTKTIK